jgi:hypothetical protein
MREARVSSRRRSFQVVKFGFATEPSSRVDFARARTLRIPIDDETRVGLTRCVVICLCRHQFSAVRSRIQSQFQTIRQNQAMLDAYAQDGWRGAAKAKPKPMEELRRAREKIFKSKLKIRELFKSIEFDPNEREITTVEDELGETDANDIFCSKCGMADDRADDDILLCDGFCDRAYHQSCVVPPVRDEDIPPEDEGWLCPLCDARVDIIYVLNDEYEHDLSQKCVAEDVFREEKRMEDEGIIPGTMKFEHAHEEEWPSDESDDEDFDKATFSDDGRDDENEALSGSARSSSEETDSSESESDLIIEGPRKRTKVDYVKLNSDMFGDDEAYEGEAQEMGWRRSTKSKMEMLAELQQKAGKTRKNSNSKSPSSKNDDKLAPKSSKSPKTKFSDAQKGELERLFTSKPNPTKSECDVVARNLRISGGAQTVKIWFMNRRRKERLIRDSA